MKNLFVASVLFFLFNNLFGQSLIQGNVKDAESGLPIPFVSLKIKDAVQATVTNQNGDFLIRVPSLPFKLIISHLSYQTVERVITSAAPINISLNLQTVQLAEVSVGNPGLTIMKLAAAKAAKSVHTEYFPKVFFRRTAFEGDDPTFFAESFIDAQWQNWGLLKYNVINSRYLQTEHGINYSNMAMLSLLSSGYVNNSLIISPINHKPDSLYTYTLKQTFKLNSHEIAVIQCKLKDPGLQHTAFEGDYYIDTENYNVLKREGTLSHLHMNASGPLNLKLKEMSIVTEYKLDADSNTVLSFSNFTLKSTLKAGFVGIKQLAYNSQIFATDYNQQFDKTALTDITFVKMQKEEEKFRSIAYDPQYWKNNAVIKRTEAEDAAVAELEKLKNVKGNINK